MDFVKTFVKTFVKFSLVIAFVLFFNQPVKAQAVREVATINDSQVTRELEALFSAQVTSLSTLYPLDSVKDDLVKSLQKNFSRRIKALRRSGVKIAPALVTVSVNLLSGYDSFSYLGCNVVTGRSQTSVNTGLVAQVLGDEISTFFSSYKLPTGYVTSLPIGSGYPAIEVSLELR